MANLDCHLNEIWNRYGHKSLDRSMREFLDYDTWVGSHTVNVGSLTSQTEFLNEKERAS